MKHAVRSFTPYAIAFGMLCLVTVQFGVVRLGFTSISITCTLLEFMHWALELLPPFFLKSSVILIAAWSFRWQLMRIGSTMVIVTVLTHFAN